MSNCENKVKIFFRTKYYVSYVIYYLDGIKAVLSCTLVHHSWATRQGDWCIIARERNTDNGHKPENPVCSTIAHFPTAIDWQMLIQISSNPPPSPPLDCLFSVSFAPSNAPLLGATIDHLRPMIAQRTQPASWYQYHISSHTLFSRWWLEAVTNAN